MNISPTSEIGLEIISKSLAIFKGMGGSVLNFQRLCSIFNVEDESEGAEVVALLCRRDVKVLKHVYFYLDDKTDVPVPLKDVVVRNYLRTGELYNPLSNELIRPELAEEFIIVEFEVLV